jgi:hypothetical protein
MNTETNSPIPTDPQTSSKPGVVLSVTAVALGLALAAGMILWPKAKPEPKGAPEMASTTGTLPSGCTRNLMANPSNETSPESGCGHCGTTGASARPTSLEACEMHPAPATQSTHTNDQAVAKRSGALHE